MRSVVERASQPSVPYSAWWPTCGDRVAHREGDLLAGLDGGLGQRHDVGIHRHGDLRDRVGGVATRACSTS
jgi:hypothetical protein